MTRQHLTAVLAFTLGACATAASQSVASPSDGAGAPTSAPSVPGTASAGAESETAPPVSNLAEADKRVAPNGSATVSILARGDAAFVARLEMKAGAVVPEHRDATEEYIHVLKGSGMVTIEGTPYRVDAGSTIFMRPGEQVSFRNDDAPMVALQIFAGPEPAAKYDAWKLVPAS